MPTITSGPQPRYEYKLIEGHSDGILSYHLVAEDKKLIEDEGWEIIFFYNQPVNQGKYILQLRRIVMK